MTTRQQSELYRIYKTSPNIIAALADMRKYAELVKITVVTDKIRYLHKFRQVNFAKITCQFLLYEASLLCEPTEELLEYRNCLANITRIQFLTDKLTKHADSPIFKQYYPELTETIQKLVEFSDKCQLA